MYPVNEENGYFTKIGYKGGGFAEATRYITTQPLDGRKKGFGTKDAHKRDEFSNGVRTEQYRESIRKEKYIIDQGAAAIQEKIKQLQLQRGTADVLMADTEISRYEKVPQFDIGRTRVTEFDPRSRKDTFYKFDDKAGKKCGMYKPVSTG